METTLTTTQYWYTWSGGSEYYSQNFDLTIIINTFLTLLFLVIIAFPFFFTWICLWLSILAKRGKK